jgi:hypothetical protein
MTASKGTPAQERLLASLPKHRQEIEKHLGGRGLLYRLQQQGLVTVDEFGLVRRVPQEVPSSGSSGV